MSCIKSIQRGWVTTQGSQVLNTVSAEINKIDPKKAFVILNTVGTNTYDQTKCGHAGLYNLWSTSIDIEVQAPSTYTTMVTWQVIEFV